LRQLFATDAGARGRLVAPALCAILLVLAVLGFALRYPASIWSMTDYELDSLSGAINLAYRLGDLRFYPAPSMDKHPGVPHYLLSWIALAFAGFPRATSGLEFFRNVLDHVERFHFIMIVLSALTGAAGIFLLMRGASRIVPVAVAAIGVLLWFGSTPYSLLSLLTLSIDSFGLALNALFVMVLWRVASEPRLEPSTMILAGAVGASAYLTKLVYINLPIALGVAIGLRVLAARGGRGWALLMAALFIYASAIIVFVVALWFIEWSSFKGLLNFHTSVFFHTGAYGTGPSGIVGTSELLNAIRSIPADGTYAIPLALVGGVILIAAGMATAIAGGDDRLPVAILATGAGVASLLSAAAVLKHYSPHYSAAVACSLPACVVAGYVALNSWARLRRPLLAAVLVAAVLCIPAANTIRMTDGLMAAYWRRTIDAQDDRKVIARYIEQAPPMVGFAYAAPFREYGEGFLLASTEIPRLTFEYLAAASRTISSATQHLAQRDIGVFIIDKARFPTAQSVKAADNFNLLGPVEKYQAGDALIELKAAFVLVRRGGAAAARQGE